VGTREGIESRILPGEGFSLEVLDVAGWVGRGWRKKWGVARRIPRALRDAVALLRRFQPDVVVGVGGYASGPAVLAAAWKGIPVVILEQNALPGMTNRALSYIVDRVVTAFEESRPFFGRKGRVRCLGNPVRPEIFGARERVVGGPRATLLVFGGSRGARAVNRAMTAALPHLASWRDRLTVIHQTGEDDGPWVRKAYEEADVAARVSPYLHRMDEAYREADLVVSRAGATTVAELAAAARPAILIPYPHAAHQHQRWNAESLRAAGAAELLPEDQLTGERLAERVSALLSDPERLRRMGEACGRLARPRAAEEIVALCRSLVRVEAGG